MECPVTGLVVNPATATVEMECATLRDRTFFPVEATYRKTCLHIFTSPREESSRLRLFFQPQAEFWVPATAGPVSRLLSRLCGSRTNQLGFSSDS
jgi:hypothetical protein